MSEYEVRETEDPALQVFGVYQGNRLVQDFYNERDANFYALACNEETAPLHAEIARLKAELEACEIAISDAIEASAPDIPPHSAEEKVEAMVKALMSRHATETNHD